MRPALTGERIKAGGPFARTDRLAYACLIGAAGAVLALAFRLRPAPEGFGTHEQLGLPPCPFLRLAGLPCPGCGLTTSFAHMARFDLAGALAAQPFGVYAFLLTFMLVPLAASFILRRVSWQEACELRGLRFVFYLTGALWLAGWVWKLAVWNH